MERPAATKRETRRGLARATAARLRRPLPAPHISGPRLRRGAILAVLALVLAGVIAAAVSSFDFSKVGHALVSASLGWLAAALALMMSAMIARSVSWRHTLLAALPGTRIGRVVVARATMIGVVGSAVFPGRLGEPARVLVIARHLPHRTRRMIPLVAGTAFSQTIINLLALAILAAVTFTSVPILHGSAGGLLTAAIVPAVVLLVVLIGPLALRLASRARSPRLRAAAATLTRLLKLAAHGLRAFAKPRHGVPAVGAQLLAWALQWVSCYAVLLALHLASKAGVAGAAAVLLAVNLSAVLPATPSNVGVFQAACLVVLAAYGVSGGVALAYGILLQAVEVVTALALGIPALLGEGMTWRDIRSARRLEAEEEAAEAAAEGDAAA
ncbi:MAG: lysylphosphatidylglycerol synthase transmembrane domain-containing protein [Solirubrobacteraceae bacterium]